MNVQVAQDQQTLTHLKIPNLIILELFDNSKLLSPLQSVNGIRYL